MDYDLIIIGSGPAGYVAAIRAGQVGLKTAVIEKSKIGGMCLNWGCIPTKALLESAKKLETIKNASPFGIDGIDEKKLSFNWKNAIKRSERIVKRLTKGIEYLLKKNSVDIIEGEAVIESEKSISVENRLLETKNIIIATGSRPRELDAPVPKEIVIGIEDLLKLEALPQIPLVVGLDPHAVELAQFFKLAGKDVKLLAPGTRLLPDSDPFLSDYVGKLLKKSKIETLFITGIKGYENGEVILDEKRILCDRIINASIRNSVLPGSNVDFSLENGFIKVDDFLKTNIGNIYAVGDVNGRSKFAHAASAQGLHAVNVIAGITKKMDFNQFPVNMYTHPEIARLGMIEPELKEKGIDYKVSEFPLSANSKARIEGHTEGLIRLLSETRYGEVLGVQIIAPHATDMISEASVLMRLEGTIFDLANTVHAHPTVSEIFMESGFAAFDQPIHK
jgi:dihydrolipoamide dehydrogenase